MFANTVSGWQFIASSLEEKDAIETIRNICTFHGLRGDGKLDDGLWILTDEKSIMLKNVVSSPYALNEAISSGKTLDSTSDPFAIPVLVDEHLCIQYYNN